MKYRNLFEPEDLHALLNEAKTPVIIVDFSSAQQFNDGHIENSINLPYSYLFCGTAPCPNKIPSPAQLAQCLAAINYHPDTLVVALDDEGGGWAGRFLWTLETIGHTNWVYLNGGLIAWKAGGFPCVTSGSNEAKSKIEPNTLPTPIIDQDKIVTKDYILETLDDEDVQFWDSRSLDEFRGIRSNSKRSGRIPNAIHCEWTSLMDSTQHYRIREDADEYLESLGFSKYKTQVTYCQSHHRSGFTWLVGTLLGYDVYSYDGGWNEWGNSTDTPISQGD